MTFSITPTYVGVILGMDIKLYVTLGYIFQFQLVRGELNGLA